MCYNINDVVAEKVNAKECLVLQKWHRDKIKWFESADTGGGCESTGNVG